ncbi:hemerythrin-like metal-binding domain-containing protein [Variovorax paradoxus B4]|uniref:Hemerythrin-like metal-binding domain-containing protein n=1 Tax=Variovorax paradoxus B4 TaxID=1246301 RepID=T1XKB2_VARPD|nr:hemerythrin-like metal-binding domain-containing protein [Variovorax paradoxus]AGU53018.1 hemerythrin-like metal-binding domain-containing protein [Variovorax paradoxus B4]
MAVLDRSDAISLGLPFMDQARGRFARLLAQVEEAGNAALPAAWRHLLAYAAELFACEDIWMRASGFAARKDHAAQHRVVLEVMREGAVHAAEGRLAQLREMARQLRVWHEARGGTMDAPLARHLCKRRAGRGSVAARPRGSHAALRA